MVHSCEEFRNFEKTSEFKHVTLSLKYPQSNALIENGVKIVKLLIKKAVDSKTDPYLALLNYWATPLSHGRSPAELLFNRQLKTRMPQLLENECALDKGLVEKRQKDKLKQKRNYDRGSKELSKLEPNDRVKLHNGKHWGLEARVLQNVAPRSYEVQTQEGTTYRRNRRHLLKVPVTEETNVNLDKANTPVMGSDECLKAEIRRSCRNTKAPLRLIQEM